MLLSALGYFAFAYYLLFRVDAATALVTNTLGFEVFFAAITGMLLFSSLWMPFTYSYVDKPNKGTWLMIRVVLFLVALSSCALVWALLSLHDKTPPGPYWVAVVGAGYFALHTTMLDAFLWPVLYR
jgi:magnesium-transporting ATPase (P-type)